MILQLFSICPHFPTADALAVLPWVLVGWLLGPKSPGILNVTWLALAMGGTDRGYRQEVRVFGVFPPCPFLLSHFAARHRDPPSLCSCSVPRLHMCHSHWIPVIILSLFFLLISGTPPLLGPFKMPTTLSPFMKKVPPFEISQWNSTSFWDPP